MLSSITGNGWALIGAALAVILAGCGSAYGVGCRTGSSRRCYGRSFQIREGSGYPAASWYTGYLRSAGSIRCTFQIWTSGRSFL